MSRKSEGAGQSRDLREVQELLGISAGAPRQLLTLPEVCQILRLLPKTLQRRIDAGEPVVVRDGGRVLVTPPDLARYIGARRTL
jgi:hypothetical protein